MKKHSPFLLAIFFVLCCCAQMGNGMKRKNRMRQTEIFNRKQETFLFFLIQKKKKELGLKKQLKNVSAKCKFTQENNTKSYGPCPDTQFPFDEDLYGGWKKKIAMID